MFVLTAGSALASPVPPIVSPTSGSPNPVPSAGTVLISTPAGDVQMPPYDGDPNAFGQVFESPCQYTGSDTQTQNLYAKEGFGANTNYVRISSIKTATCRRSTRSTCTMPPGWR